MMLENGTRQTTSPEFANKPMLPQWADSTTKIACAVIALIIVPICVSYAQDANLVGSEQPKSDVISLYSRTPATVLDVGVMQMRQNLITSFMLQKPSIFEKDFFRLIDVSTPIYTNNVPLIGNNIIVEVSHYSTAKTAAQLSEECKQDLNIALSGLTMNVDWSPPQNSEDALAIRDRKCARVDALFSSPSTFEFMLRHEISKPGDNICNNLRVLAQVSSRMEPPVEVTCSKMFFDEEPRVTVEAP